MLITALQTAEMIRTAMEDEAQGGNKAHVRCGINFENESCRRRPSRSRRHSRSRSRDRSREKSPHPCTADNSEQMEITKVNMRSLHFQATFLSEEEFGYPALIFQQMANILPRQVVTEEETVGLTNRIIVLTAVICRNVVQSVRKRCFPYA